MRTHGAAAAALAVVVVALTAACGGDDGGAGGGERLTKEEFIAAADEICADASAEIDALGDPASAEEAVEFTNRAVEIGRQQLERLRALAAPEEDQATLDEAYGLIEQQLDIGEQLGEAAAAEDLAKIDELVAEGDKLNARADQIAADYGLKECGSS